MTGQELIELIKNNHLEDYTIITSHETGEGSYPILDVYIDHAQRTVEVV